jgi:hypothetical protein
MSNYIFIIILLIIIAIIFIFSPIERFHSNCGQYGGDYNLCYNNNCTIMIGDDGSPFCVDKFLYEGI